MREECLESAEDFRGESRSGGGWLSRSVSLACACWGSVGGLISDLRKRAFLRFSRANALVLASAFGGECSVLAVGCLPTTDRGGENISFRYGGESFVGSTFISNV